MIIKNYETSGIFDEMFIDADKIRSYYLTFKEKLDKISPKRLKQLQLATDKAQLLMGMTFNVYGDDQGIERILQLDIIPRIISGKEWDQIERGLQQRIEALNLFIDDIYHDQKICKDGVVPVEVIASSPCYLKQCHDLNPSKNRWCHIIGTDLIRGEDGSFYVLEDNLRCPSGVSYLLENREILKSTFPEVFEKLNVRPVYDYPIRLLEMLQYISNQQSATVALLTPGIFNSAYFEHSYLAQQMGIELVEGNDLVVKDDYLYMYTTTGLQRVDVLYRRIDDTFIDPLHFNPDSVLGVPGLFDVYKKGNVTIANAPGTGVADDKAVYAYIPKIIQYYLDQEMIIPNVKTYICSFEEDRTYVLENIAELVVKETNAAGGYGMLIGPKSTKAEQKLFKEKIKADPRNFIAQPTISLSTVPTIAGNNRLEPRHVDLRPYILYGEKIEVVPGALTRVALKKGSLVVNSSQGGGSKDTWVIDE